MSEQALLALSQAVSVLGASPLQFYSAKVRFYAATATQQLQRNKPMQPTVLHG
jgi:hypothetical protein